MKHITRIFKFIYLSQIKKVNIDIISSRYQSGDQTPGSETGGPTTGAPVAPPGDLDVKTQILQQQELQKQASAAAKSKGNSAPTSPMKDGKKASFFGKVHCQHYD